MYVGFRKLPVGRIHRLNWCALREALEVLPSPNVGLHVVAPDVCCAPECERALCRCACRTWATRGEARPRRRNTARRFGERRRQLKGILASLVTTKASVLPIRGEITYSICPKVVGPGCAETKRVQKSVMRRRHIIAEFQRVLS